MLDGRRAQLAELLFELGAIRFGAFKLKLHETHPDAPLSPIYLNLRTSENPKPGPLTREALDLAGGLMLEAAGTIPDAVAGIPNAGDPFADAIARAKNGVALVRLGKEERDGKRTVTGVRDSNLPTGTEVLVVDDLITRADSKFEAIRALEKAGLRVHGLVVLVDRQQGGRQQVESAGYHLASVYTLEELLTHYVAVGHIEHFTAEAVLKYVRSQSA